MFPCLSLSLMWAQPFVCSLCCGSPWLSQRPLHSTASLPGPVAPDTHWPLLHSCQRELFSPSVVCCNSGCLSRDLLTRGPSAPCLLTGFCDSVSIQMCRWHLKGEESELLGECSPQTNLCFLSASLPSKIHRLLKESSSSSGEQQPCCWSTACGERGQWPKCVL